MPADTDASSDHSRNDVDGYPREELAEAIEEFDDGETPTEDEVREAFLS